MNLVTRLRGWARGLKREIYALYLASHHPYTPWYAKLLAAAVVGYAFSPLDLIPDFVPVLGYLDDLILVPAGIAMVLRLIPREVIAECRKQALAAEGRPTGWVVTATIIVIWLGVAALAARFVWLWLDQTH